MTNFSKRLRRMEADDVALLEYSVSDYRKIKALNSHYKEEHFTAKQYILLNQDTLEAEKVLVIGCIKPLP